MMVLEERRKMGHYKMGCREGLASLQWLVFMLAQSVTFPIVIGQVFQLPVEEIAGLMQRTFFLVGLASLLQGWLGHRLPIVDGPAGMWLGVFVLLGEMTIKQGANLADTLQVLQGGMLISGILLLFFGVSGLIRKILPLFTPLVTGTFLVLLAFQLSGVFLRGMLGIHGTPPQADYVTSVLSFFIFLFVLGLSIWGKGWMKSYAVLMGILAGWIFYYAWGKVPTPHDTEVLIRLPELFAWGLPQWDAGMAASSVLLSFILISNTIAAIAAVEQAVPQTGPKDHNRLERGGVIGGLTHVLGSAFSTIGIVPLPVSAGFIRLTGQRRMKPFMLACLTLTLVSLFPSVIGQLALIPGPVAYAVSMASMIQLLGIGLLSIISRELEQRRLTILGVGILFGAGIMFLPPTIFQGLPTAILYIASNGLLVGTMLVLLLEKAWPEKSEVGHAGMKEKHVG